MISEISGDELHDAARIHSIAWQESHRSFCCEEFVAMHTPERQMKYLSDQIRSGGRLYMLKKPEPVGIVTVKGDLIEDLYVLPSEWGRGNGRELLLFAISKCLGDPKLWVLCNNTRAYRLYLRFGFRPTGEVKRLSDALCEIEMKRSER